VRQIKDQEDHDTLTSQVIQATGVSRDTANIGEAVVFTVITLYPTGRAVVTRLVGAGDEAAGAGARAGASVTGQLDEGAAAAGAASAEGRTAGVGETIVRAEENAARTASTVARTGGEIAETAARGSVLEGANFAQKTYGPMFSRGGAFVGRSVDDVAAALRSGAMRPSEVPINYIVRDGKTLILNTRSAQALEAAGIPRSAWSAVNRTGQEMFENMLTGQLQRNGLTSAGIATVRRSGGK
jgi:hypothetical protein